MKKKLLLALALIGAMGINRLQAAADYYTTAGGNWEDSVWNTANACPGAAAWVEGSDAHWFPSCVAAGTYTINAANAHNIFGFYLDTASTTVNVMGGTLTMPGNSAGATSANVASGSTLTISNTLAGSGSCVLMGAGTGSLVLAGNNTFTGDTAGNNGGVKLFAGNTLVVASDQALGSSSGSFLYMRTGTSGNMAHLKSRGTEAHVIPNAVRFFGSSQYFEIGGSGQLTFSGPVHLQKEDGSVTGVSYLYVNNSADTIFSGKVDDAKAGGLLKQGGGKLILSNGGNAWTGWTDLIAGQLLVGASPNALGKAGSIADYVSGACRSVLVFDASSATGCFLGTRGGPQTVSSGQPSMYMQNNGSFINTDTLTFNATYAMDFGPGGSSTLGLYNTADVVLAGYILSGSSLGSTTSAGGGTSGGIHLSGGGRIVFQSTNSASPYKGDTYVDTGTLAVTATSGKPTGTGTVRIGNTGILTGTGLVGPVILSSGGAISPGNWPALGPGRLTTGALTFAAGGHYFWQMNDAAGAQGTAYSWLNCTGALTVSATPSSPCVIDIALLTAGNQLGAPANFDPTSVNAWIIATATSISGVPTDSTTPANNIVCTSSAYPSSAFSVLCDGFNLILFYTPATPNPNAVATLYNTGLAADGSLMAPGGVDAHWTLTSSPDANYPGPNLPNLQTISTGIATTWNLWKATPYSWPLGPRSDATPGVAPGDYVYHTTFDLTGFNPDRIIISGRMTADDSITSFKINGVESGIAASGFTAWNNFLIPAGLTYAGNQILFNQGVNSVDITVHNGGASANPSGFNMQWKAYEVCASQIQSLTVNTFDFTAGGVAAVTPNTTVTLVASLYATGPNGINFQWYKGSTALSDATPLPSGATATGSQGTIIGTGLTNTTLVLANFNDLDHYSCTFSNVDCTSSTSAPLIVPTACPYILTNPVSKMFAAGANASFGALVAGPSLNYQWYLNGAPVANSAPHITGAMAPVLLLTNLVDADAGTYYCSITNACGVSNTLTASLTVVHAPTNVVSIRMLSNNAAFHVVAAGTPCGYQWSRNGVSLNSGTGVLPNITGMATPDLLFTPVLWDGATYSCLVTNGDGCSGTYSATLTLDRTWAFDSFEFYANGALDKNWGNTTPGPNAAADGAGNPWFGDFPYNATVGGSASTLRSRDGAKMLTHNGNYDTFWLNLAYRLGGGSALQGNFSVEWWFYDPAGASAANNPYAYSPGLYDDYGALCIYPNAPVNTDFPSNDQTADTTWSSVTQRMSFGAYPYGTGADTTKYQVRIIGATDTSDGNGWINTTATRSVGWHHARILLGPPNGANTIAFFFMDDLSAPCLTHAIMKTGGFNIFEMNMNGAGATSVAGAYDAVTFLQHSDPWIIEQPASMTVQPGAQGTFNIAATGTNYQWYEDGNPIPGASATTLYASDLATYTCVVQGNSGSVTSAPVVLSNDSLVWLGSGFLGLYSQGDDTTYNNIDASTPACAGVVDQQVFYNGGEGTVVTAEPASCPGLAPSNFNVRWTAQIMPASDDTYTFYAQGDDGVRLWVDNQLVLDHWILEGATEWSTPGIWLQGGHTYNIKMEYCQHGGGAYCSLAWSGEHMAKQLIPAAAVFPYNCPLLTGEPADMTVSVGDPASFSVSALGANPLGYQWYLNDTNGNNQAIAGATDPTLVLNNVQPTDALNYYFCVVSNSCGSTNSSIGRVYVNPVTQPPTPPLVAIVPFSQSVGVGGNATFTVRGGGPVNSSPPMPFGVDWYDDTANLPGLANQLTITLTGAQTATAGTNSIEADVTGNGWGNSGYATLIVTNLPPTFPPLITSFTQVDSTHYSINWAYGTSSSVLLSTTNLNMPGSWMPVATNPSLPCTITVSSNAPAAFYRVRQ